MINKLIKKIWFVCLLFTSLVLVGCFHVPDEDWLLSDWETKLNTGKNDDLNQAFDSFISDFNTISDQRTEMKNNENDWVGDGDLEKTSINTGYDEIINDEDVVNEENVIKKEKNDK